MKQAYTLTDLVSLLNIAPEDIRRELQREAIPRGQTWRQPNPVISRDAIVSWLIFQGRSPARLTR